jgi:hypothetical protein
MIASMIAWSALGELVYARMEATMSQTERTPHIDGSLLEWLDRLFPDQCPPLAFAEKEVWFAAGAARVVRRLKEEYKRQTERTDVLRP